MKTHFELDPQALGDVGQTVADRARRGRPGPLPFLRETRRQFTPRALDDLARLRDALPPEGSPSADAARLAFGRILIPASRLHRSPCLGYSRSQDPDGPSPLERFRASIRVMQEDLEHLGRERDRWGPASRVETRDARAGGAAPRSVDLAVTSPPYVNGMDYVMNYKIDLAWLGYARSVRGPAGPPCGRGRLRQPAAVRDRRLPRATGASRPLARGDPASHTAEHRAQGQLPP